MKPAPGAGRRHQPARARRALGAGLRQAGAVRHWQPRVLRLEPARGESRSSPTVRRHARICWTTARWCWVACVFWAARCGRDFKANGVATRWPRRCASRASSCSTSSACARLRPPMPPCSRPRTRRDCLPPARAGWTPSGLPFAGPTVVITHHAPTLHSTTRDLRARPFNAALCRTPNGCQAAGARSCGFTATRTTATDYVIDRTRVLCNPRGYVKDGQTENPHFNPELVQVG